MYFYFIFLKTLQYQFDMNNEPNIQPPQPILIHPRPRRKFIILLVISSLILLPLQSLAGNNQDFTSDGIYSALNTIDPEVKQPMPITGFYNSILYYFNQKQVQGVWKHKIDSDIRGALTHPGGKAIINFGRHMINNTESIYAILKLYNGNYIDHGYSKVILPLGALSGKYTQTKGNYTFYMENELKVDYNFIVRLNTVIPEKQIDIKSLKISFTQFQNQDKPAIFLYIDTDEFQIDVISAVQSWHIFHHIFLSLLLTCILSAEFISSAKIMRKIGLGQQHGEKYSLITFFMILMWDLVITIVTFSLSFSNDQLFLIYLIPTFISGILFAILELRILQYVFEAQFHNRGVNIKQFMRFLAWFGLISTYPIIVYTNLSSLFFALLPLIMIPQLYKNAERGRRSNLDIDFLKLFLPRFAFILYLKGFSKNVFNIQPSVTCCLGMFALLALMIGFLILQKVYGNRIIFPRFLLPNLYNYFKNQNNYSINIQMGADNVQDCAICLTPVHMQPAEQSQLSGQFVGKIMTTPCRHNFHGSCLVQWMQHKMECPTCRSKLPAYD